MSDGGQTLAQSVQTLPFGPLTSLTYGNGLSLTRDYDASYRLQRSRVTSLLDDTYGYTARDNISTIVDGVNGASPRSYQYDELERVTDESGDDGK